MRRRLLKKLCLSYSAQPLIRASFLPLQIVVLESQELPRRLCSWQRSFGRGGSCA